MSSRRQPVSTQSWWLYWLAQTSMSIKECRSRVRLSLPSNGHHIIFFLLGWFVRCKVSVCTATVLWDAAPRIYSKQLGSILVQIPSFTLSVSLDSSWCYHTVVLTWQLLGRILVFFYVFMHFFFIYLLCGGLQSSDGYIYIYIYIYIYSVIHI